MQSIDEKFDALITSIRSAFTGVVCNAEDCTRKVTNVVHFLNRSGEIKRIYSCSIHTQVLINEIIKSKVKGLKIQISPWEE